MLDNLRGPDAPLTAIVCEDDSMTRMIVRSAVERAGFTILAGVDNAIDALKLVLEHQPDVLILDLVLPGMAGEEIIEAIQECGNTAVIVHSAHDPRFAIKRGARMFVSKGQIALLEQTLAKVASNRTRATA